MKERDLGFTIQLIANTLKKRANQELEAHGITMKQGRFLGYLHEREGRTTTQKDFQRHFEITHPTAIGILKRLEQKGFVRTRTDESDRRIRIVELDPREEPLHAAMIRLRGEMEGKLTAGLTEEECRQLRDLLERVHDNIREK
ncbi:MAG: MarR family transcriptional regulator [Spirochaetales bacterium]|nr:MarR family transcriptional regulator [Spirochaetales bacterium]